MDPVKWYGGLIESLVPKNPEKAGKLIRTGLRLEEFRCAHLPEKQMPQAYRYLNYMAVKVVADALSHPETCAWTNIFAPTELLQSFGLCCISMECLSSYLSGFCMEDYFIDRAEADGLPTTLCSYHKGFIGAAGSGVLPKPVFGVTTSATCDGNISTFRWLRERCGVKDFVIDVPYAWSPEAEEYVVRQLRELISVLAEATGKKYDEDALREILRRENRSKTYFQAALEKRLSHTYPNTLTLVLFLLLATHLYIGSEWVEKFFRIMSEEVERYPDLHEKRIFWIHITPYLLTPLQKYLNYNSRYAIVCDDFNLDYMEMLDESHPLHALARKMILNVYNGDFQRKADACADNIQKYRCDAAVEFCHWGCKQSAGGAVLLKEKLRKAGTPMLVLDGDALDRRNNHDGQVKTRFEAFLEMLEKGGDAAR